MRRARPVVLLKLIETHGGERCCVGRAKSYQNKDVCSSVKYELVSSKARPHHTDISSTQRIYYLLIKAVFGGESRNLSLLP